MSIKQPKHGSVSVDKNTTLSPDLNSATPLLVGCIHRDSSKLALHKTDTAHVLYNNTQNVQFQGNDAIHRTGSMIGANQSAPEDNQQNCVIFPSTPVVVPKTEPYLGGQSGIGGGIVAVSDEISHISDIGIDTCHLFLVVEPGKIVQNGQLKVHSPAFGKKKTLFIDIEGEEVQGTSATFYLGPVTVNLFPLKQRRTDKNRPTFGACGCNVQFSIAGIVGSGDNTNPPSFPQVKSAISYVERALAKIGIETDIVDATVSRLDLFRNLYVDSGSLQSYLDVFRSFCPSRKRSKNYPTTVTHSNKSSAIVIYDKHEARRARGSEIALSEQVGMRVEVQLKKSQKVREATSIGTVRDLLNSHTALGNFYARELQKHYFHVDVDKLVSSRGFAGGRVAHRLDTLWRRLQNMPWAHHWTRDRLDMNLRVFGYEGLMSMLKADSRTATKAERNWVLTRLRSLKDAILAETMSNPEFKAQYMALRAWLCGEQFAISRSPQNLERRRAV